MGRVDLMSNHETGGRVMYEFVTKDNVLDLVESYGRDMKGMTSPYSHPYDDERRAASYVPLYKAARWGWNCIQAGADPVAILTAIRPSTGVSSNHVRLLVSALRGEFERQGDWFRNIPPGHHWVTYKGDFYSVNAGDNLNLPGVSRIANEYMPEDKKRTDGAQEIADMMPNPCTRISRPIQVH